MSTPKNYLIALLALTTVGGATLLWRQHLELVQLRASAFDPSERADLQKRIWDLQKSNHDLESRLAAEASGDADAAEPAAETPVPDARPLPEGPHGRFQRFAAIRALMAKPEVQAMMNTAMKSNIDARYQSLFRQLNLSPEQSAQLENLLVERQNTLQDVMAAAREQGINPRSDPDAFHKLLTDAENSVNDGIKSLLGDDGYQQFSNYEQTLPQRGIVDLLQQRLSSANATLNSAQADQLVQILASNSPTKPNNNLHFGNPMGTVFGQTASLVGPGSAKITPTAVSQASGILTPDQLAGLQQLQQQQKNAQELQKMMKNAWRGGSATPAPSSGAPAGGTRPPG